MADRLFDAAAAALAEKLAAMTPDERAEDDDPGGWKRREAARQAAEDARYRRASEMFEASPVKGWFPDVEWLITAVPDYPRNSVVARDAWDDSRPVRNQPHLMVQWTDQDPEHPEIGFKVTVTSGPSTDTSTGYPYWSEGPEVHDAAEVGAVLEKWKAIATW